ncbi:DUF502 domain-containing protein [Halostella salina]|uniref:DUF502 domain-containing protein n=1 Tax=Halostella salina TaxID=1547897 RepID=UPI000EF84EF6|nr:DUF502 domain-containing protein [Halostella salina]
MNLGEAFKRSFVAGLILVAPLVVTLYVITTLVRWSLVVVDPIVAGTRLTQFTGNDWVAAQLLAVALIVAGIAVVGSIAQRTVGSRVFGNVGRVVNFVPLVNTIYSSVRQVASALVERDSRYDSVVLVEYPRNGIYALGFVTGESPEPVLTATDERAYNVFLPNSPNPTGGRLALVPEEQITEIDMSVREGLRQVVTTGMKAEEMEATAGVPVEPASNADAETDRTE